MSDKIIGVGFLLFSEIEGDAKFAVVEELRNKPEIGKEKGMRSFPLETHEKRDDSIVDTIHRLLMEEIGIAPEEAQVRGICPEEFSLIPGRADIITRYGHGVLRGDPYRKLYPRQDDTRFAGWMSAKELLQKPVRVEVRPILEHFFRTCHYRQVLKRLRSAACE